MNRVGKQFAVCVLTAAVTFTGAGIEAMAGSSVTSVLPSAGIGYELATDQVEVSNLQEDEQSNSSADSASSSTGSSSSSSSGSSTTSTKEATNTTPLSSRVDEEVLSDIEEATGATTTTNEEETFSNLVIAQVHDYVNVRSGPSENDEIVGKLYNNSVGTYLGEENGWYQIKSGSVTGYVKAEYCVTGQAAVELAPKVGKRIATVTTTTLKVRKEASTESEVLGLVPIDDELVVLEELDGWVKVEIEEGEGYVSMDYVRLSTEFVQAESKAEEEARLAKEQAAKEAARAAASSNTSKSSSSKDVKSAESFTTEKSSIGEAVAAFAVQFVGNPYVYGGTSLTNGCDCSGFVMSVYANFGVSLPHSSAADRNVGAAVDGLANAQPGDIVCYSGHVAIYIGGGQIVHASTSKTGIIISNANYRTPLAVRRIF
ncbi:Cell wall-associated hydrolase, NlpC family [Butyrivibrio fibrisolvens DSM 3071]|uniref:Cell wall-associated hydrolase, NlpC family n=1 Tax=Butyrivibrio fibrisolvens DSM 3071 TaxID=1121131 RepID=A0A1M6DH98_BUTFI|nr:C40 family peptidase [Butyrivibrio fibrisolvens]SHI72552.1 Cell wall-associated hydrolase, NlpC family [Butyrivibrio fibrisolvens DSM 3071]